MKLTEATTIPNYNLHDKYQYFNRLLFKGELPNMPLKWSNSKTMAGFVRVGFRVKKIMGKKVVQSYEFIQLSLSKFYERSEDDFDGILVHEMIHVYLDINGIHEGYDGVKLHGKEFMDKLNQLQKKVKFKIVVADNMPTSKVAKGNVKEVGVILVKDKGTASIAVFSKNAFIKFGNELNRSRWIGGKDWSAFDKGLVSDELITKYPAKRSAKSVGFYKLDTEIYNTLLKQLKPTDSAVSAKQPKTKVVVKKKTPVVTKDDWGKFFSDNAEDLAQLGI